jgi:GNAT superfamily N-acetyltransferase
MSATKDFNFLKELTFEPLSKTNWRKFAQFFENNGACGKCWCMYFRLKKQAFEEGKENGGNKELMKKLVWDEQPTGMLGFYEGRPIAWCAFAPRENYVKVENSRVHKRIDDKPVWSITCFFIEKTFRKQGVSVELLKAVIKYAKSEKIKTIEAYPTIPTQEILPDGFAWIGLYKSFEQAGFKIVDRTSKYRPMVRYET